jgi:aspartate carbamoyltransferase catalytic subunit
MQNLNHLIDIKSLSKNDLEQLFTTADTLKHTPIKESQLWHPDKSAMALFFENSTRTLTSFQLACQRLGVDITALNIAYSSTQKGESIKDTLETLNAMQTDLFIVRHPENHMQQQMLEWQMVNSAGEQTHIINAGDGTNQHPTQALLDLYTIKQHKKAFSPLKVAIIGDIKHSRVANSLIDGLGIMGTTDIQVYGPDSLIPESAQSFKAPSMQAALNDCDVVVMLRIQKERLSDDTAINFSDWHQSYGINASNLKWAKKDAIVMHPGPMNRGVEISDEVADGPQSVILEQVRNGVLMRQALIHQLLIHI